MTGAEKGVILRELRRGWQGKTWLPTLTRRGMPKRAVRSRFDLSEYYFPMSGESKLKLVDTLLSILQKFDWIQPLLGTIGGIVLGLWSGIDGKVGTPGSVAIGLLTFAAVLWIFNSATTFLKNHASPKPEYEIWDQVQFLTLRQAALLWAETSVTVKVLPEPAYARLRMLKEQIIVGAMETLYEISGEPDQGTLVTREDLTKVAEELGERPKFLFVESR